MDRIRLALAWLSAGLLILISVIFFGAPPLSSDFTYLGFGEDPQQFIWFLNWWPYAWAHHLDLFKTFYVAAPVGMGLAWRTSIPGLGLVAAPFTNVFGALASFNWLMRLAPGLAGAGMFWAAREATNRILPAFVAGLIFGFSSYEMSQSLGHLNLNFTIVIPLLLLTCLRASRRNWSNLALSSAIGGLLAFQFYVSQEITASALLFSSMILIYFKFFEKEYWIKSVKMLPGLVGGLVVSGILISPLLYTMLFGGDRVNTDIAQPSAYSTDLLNFIVPTPITLPFATITKSIAMQFKGNFSEEAGYVGLPMIILLTYIYQKSHTTEVRLPVKLAFYAAIASIGPILHVAGHSVFIAPWLLVSWIPVIHDMLPARFMLYAFLMLAMAIAVWLSQPGSKKIIAARYALVGFAFLWCVPNQKEVGYWTDLHIPKIFTSTSSNEFSADSAVLILPFVGNHIAEQYASHMNFRMVAEGYLGGGFVKPFNTWPLMQALNDNKFNSIDRHEFSVFLQQFGVQEILIETSQITNSNDAVALVEESGWHKDKKIGNTDVYVPPPTQYNPVILEQQVTFYQHENLLKTLERREQLNVCLIRRFEDRFHNKLGFVWWIYQHAFQLPLSIYSIRCGT